MSLSCVVFRMFALFVFLCMCIAFCTPCQPPLWDTHLERVEFAIQTRSTGIVAGGVGLEVGSGLGNRSVLHWRCSCFHFLHMLSCVFSQIRSSFKSLNQRNVNYWKISGATLKSVSTLICLFIVTTRLWFGLRLPIIALTFTGIEFTVLWNSFLFLLP